MTETKQLIEDLKAMHDGDPWHGPSLKSLLEGLTPAQAAAKPIPDAHSIWEIVLHLRGWQEVGISRLSGQARMEPEAGDFPAVDSLSEAEWQRAITTLDSTLQRLIDKIASLTTEDLDQIMPGKDYNARFLLKGLAHHTVYHAAQIALLRKYTQVSV